MVEEKKNDEKLFRGYLDMAENRIVQILNGGKLNSITVLSVIINLMQLAESFTGLPGASKKLVVLEAIKRFIFVSNPENVEGTIDIDLLSGLVDTMINIEKGEITIKFDPKKCCPCF